MTFEKSVKYEEIDVEESAEGYVELFSRVGVDYVFGSPGSEFIPVWEYLAKYNSQGRRPYYINSRHEGLSLSLAKGHYGDGKASSSVSTRSYRTTPWGDGT
ncbi:MAG: thiamine pyrophosphate-binding protein [Candidatus Bathyarchaeia archaeon]